MSQRIRRLVLASAAIAALLGVPAMTAASPAISATTASVSWGAQPAHTAPHDTWT